MNSADGTFQPGFPEDEPRDRGTAAAEPPAPVGPENAEAPTRRGGPGIARRALVLLAIGAAVAAGLIGAGTWWRWLRPAPVRDHWDAVARGRTYLRYGRPDL